MGFMEAVQICLKKYVGFEGRAQRSEYWWFFLFTLLVGLVATLLDGVLGTAGGLNAIVSLAFLLPGIAVAVRRLHDRDMSGWWALLFLVPLVGFIILIILFIMKGTDGDNRFGPDPLR